MRYLTLIISLIALLLSIINLAYQSGLHDR